MNRHHFALGNDDQDSYYDSDRYWRAFFDKALDAMLIADDDGLYVDANPAACELFGLPLTELLGCNISDFSEPDFDFSLAWRSFLEQGELKGEFCLFRRDGVVKNLEFAATANFLPHRHLSILRDITERKQNEMVMQYNQELTCINERLKQEIKERQESEETLRKSQTFLFQIIDTIPDPVFVKNEHHQWIVLNNTCCDFVGIDRTDLIGKTDYDVFPKEEADVFWGKDTLVLNTGIEHENEESFTNSQGETRIILTKKSLLKDAYGKKNIVGLIRDVTEHKFAEAALKDSENRFRSMFEQGAIGTVIASLNGDFLQVNQKFCDLVGYSQTELLNLNYTDITYPDEQRDQTEQWHSLLIGKISTYSQEKRYIHKDSSLVWVKVTISLMRTTSGDPQYAVGMVEDINNIKKSEAFLHRREEQFRALVENSPDIVVRYDKELRFLYVNPSMQQATGILSEMFIGKRHQDLGFPADKCAFWDEALQAVFLTGQEQVIEFDFMTPNALKVYQTRLVPEFYQEKSIDSVLGVSRDITEHKQAEIELQQAKQAADVANRTKSDFMTSISHELRTPLNGILGYTQILKQDKNLLERQHNSLNIIYQCGTHLLTLIDDILDFSKIESQKTELCLTEFNFENFLNTLVQLFRMRAQQKGISFTYQNLSPLPKIIVADEKRLRQVLINLLSNAVKFTDLGGVTFKVFTINNFTTGLNNIKTEKVAENLVNTRVRFQVEDTGIGINSNHFQEIFLPFCQVGDRSRFTEGTGLGLAISQKLVKFMDSSIQVKSTLTKGSVFWFDLEMLQASEYFPINIDFKTKKRRVLIVDDSQEFRLLLRELLKPLGLVILEAMNGQDCLSKASEFRPNLILMNLTMPVNDSFEIFERLKDLVSKDTIIIALSDSNSQDTRQASLNIGFHEVLFKPVQAEQLLKLIENYLAIEPIQNENFDSTTVESNLLFAPITAPSSSELSTLTQLVQMGDITGIINYAERLEMLDSNLLPFTTQTRQLAKSFKLKQLLEFIEQCLEGH